MYLTEIITKLKKEKLTSKTIVDAFNEYNFENTSPEYGYPA